MTLFVASVAEFVAARQRRYADATGARAFAEAQSALVLAAGLLAVVAALPMVVRLV